MSTKVANKPSVNGTGHTPTPDPRLASVKGTWSGVNKDTVAWNDVLLGLTDGVFKDAMDGIADKIVDRMYLYTDLSAEPPLRLFASSSLASIGNNDTLIAIADPGDEIANVHAVVTPVIAPVAEGGEKLIAQKNMPPSKPISAAQRRHVERLAAQLKDSDQAFDAAKVVFDAAKALHDSVQASANHYLVYLTDEYDASGKEGWRFDQQAMAFVPVSEKDKTEK